MRRFTLILLTLCLAACAPRTKFTKADIGQLRNYIAQSWEKTVQYNPEDDGTLLGLPCRYTVPTPSGGMFMELYYWDTYFTIEGLIADGEIELAKGNAEDIMAMVDRFGFMPNGTRTWYLSRSQPPFLSLMVRAVYGATGDRDWLARAYPTLEREYEYWQTKHMTPCGLNRYSGDGADQSLIDEFVVTASRRLGVDFNAMGLTRQQHDKLGYDFVAEAESGWDFNPRFDRRCGDFCPVDLNSLLYAFEVNMAEFATILGKPSERWLEAARSRRAKMTELMFDPEQGQFFDYDFVGDRKSDVVSAAVFTALYCGVPTAQQAKGVRTALRKLEFEYGLTVCEKRDYGYTYQWSYPNTWPPTTFMAVFGLDKYGFRRDAKRLAAKYMDLVVSSYKTTGTIWEKYDAVRGVMSEGEEYDTPEMFGWSAGAFNCLSDYYYGKQVVL